MNHPTHSAAGVFDVDSARRRFTSLNNSDFAYFDAPAGSQVPDEVGEAIAHQMRDSAGNIGGPFRTTEVLTKLVSTARERSAQFLGGQADCITFGASMTTLNFDLSRTATRDFRPRDEIIVTALDHEGNVAPWREVALDRDLIVRVCDVTDDMRIDIEHLRSLVNERTKIIAFTLAANTTGSLTDALEISKIAHEVGAITWVDAVHYAAHQGIDIGSIGADVLLCSAYKFCGPHMAMAHVAPEIGAPWRAYNVLNRADFPLGPRFENGSPPFEQLAGLVATFDYLDSVGGFEMIVPHEHGLAARLMEQLPDGVVIHGPELAHRVPTLLTTVDGVSGADVARKLAAQDIGVLPHNFGYEVGMKERFGATLDAIRIGIAHYNTVDEIDRLCVALDKVVASR